MIGQCRECSTRGVTVYPARRKGGGNYRRAHRWYSSSICTPCAVDLLRGTGPHQVTASQWSIDSLRAVVRTSSGGGSG